MKNILLDLSGKIEPIYFKALEKIKEVSAKYGLSFIVIGAIARILNIIKKILCDEISEPFK